MNAPQLSFESTGKSPNQTDELIRILHEAEGNWVPLPFLVDAMGCFCVHSRAADGRRLGCNIENKVEYSPITKKRHSWYRLIAPQ